MSNNINRRKVLKNIAVAGAITGSPAIVSGDQTNKKEILKTDVVQEVLNTAGDPEIEKLHDVRLETIKHPEKKLAQQVEITKGITSNGGFRFSRAVGGTETTSFNNSINIDKGDISVVYTFDEEFWTSKNDGQSPITPDKRSLEKRDSLPRRFKKSPPQIVILGDESAGERKIQIMREATIDEKETIIKSISSPDKPLAGTSNSNQDAEIQVEDQPIMISITDNTLIFGDATLEFRDDIDLLNKSVERQMAQKSISLDLKVRANSGCGCWDIGLFDNGPCPKCAASHPACAAAIAACVASLGLTCLGTVPCAFSMQACACCIICIDDDNCRHPCG
jgi:hypothetical protein